MVHYSCLVSIDSILFPKHIAFGICMFISMRRCLLNIHGSYWTANCMIPLQILRSRHRKAVIKSLPKDVDPSIIEHDVVVTGGVEEELYGCFDPDYLYQWLKSADEDMLLDFDKLSIMLSPYLSEDSYSSYLSQEIVARFWRKLVDGFPEVY